MTHPRAVTLGVLTTLSLCAPATPALALTGVVGGTQAPSAAQAGGSEYGISTRAAQTGRPVVGQLGVPASVAPGRVPRVSLRVDERGVGTVYVQVAVTNLASRALVTVATLGWTHTGRMLSVSWPARATLAPGSYHVSVSAHDHHGNALLRRAHSTGVASLTVTAPPPPVSVPAAPAPVSPPPAALEAGVPTPAQTVAAGAVFPVVGTHSFGGPENRFGAARSGHVHQGQDVLASEGVPDVAPMSGTISSTSYQAGGAGYYAVEHTAVGFDFMFAHCEADSLLVATGQAVSAGQTLCKLGQTGDATAPHLHFEMWVGGWQAAPGHPIDPLPYLEAWEHAPGAG